MSPELNNLLIEVIKGFVYGSAGGLVIGVIIFGFLFWNEFKDWRR